MSAYICVLDDLDSGELKARVHYTLTGGGDGTEPLLTVTKIIPATYRLTEADELRLRLYAAVLDEDAADPMNQEDPPENEEDHYKIHWGVRG